MMVKNKQWIGLSLISVLLSGCQTIEPAAESETSLAVSALEQLQSRSSDVSNISDQEMLDSLLPPVTLDTPAPVEERFDVLVKNIDARSFLLGLVDDTPFNMVVSPEVDLKISLQLNNVNVSEVLSAVERIYPLMVERQGNLFFVSSAESMAVVYPVNYINLTRSGKSRTNVAGQTVAGGSGSNQQAGSDTNTGSNNGNSGQNVTQLNSSEISTETLSNFWEELKASLDLIIKDEEKANIVVSPQAGVVVVKALPATQRLISEYLGVTQQSLNRQVILEAKIIEVTLNDGFQAGVDWRKIFTVNNNDSLFFGQQGQILNQPVSESPFNGVFSMLYQSNSFETAIDLLKSQGDVQVLSSPRISTVNNQKAVIKVGSDEFFVTDVSTTTVTGTSTSTTPDVTLTPFFSGISLDVTPQINQQGEIILHIHPIVSEVDDQQKTLTLGQDEFTLPLALTNVRESDSIVRTKNQQVIVIGGLMQNKVEKTNTSTPFIGDVPLLGNLFKQTRESLVKSELVILLRANLVTHQQTRDELEQVKSRFNGM